eukprot:gene9178-6604_t
MDINIHIHHLEYRFHESFRPRLLQYTVSDAVDDAEAALEVTAICFSHDAQYLAVATDRASVGVLIFDQVKGSLVQTLATDGVPLSVSFHPNDSSKVCITGESNMVRFWRFTNKSAHVAPVVGLRRGNFSYCCHVWIAPFSETSIVMGSTTGFIVPIQNCEQRAPIHQSFGEPGSQYPEENAITQMLIKGDHIIVASPRNRIVLYEVRRSALNKGNGLTASLFPLACYRLPTVERIYGLAFANRESITSYSLVACTSDSLVSLDIITDFDLSGGHAAKEKAPTSKASAEDGDKEQHDLWLDRPIKKEIYKFHAAPVQCLAFSARSRSFLTSSFQDKSVRIWDFDKPSTYEPCWLVESFHDRPMDNPLFIDFHPSGLQVLVANEMEVKEYAISDGQLDLMRKFSVRTPFQGSNGVPVVVSQPVAMVKYSNGGHLLAVVAGKYVQIFHSYSPDFDATSASEIPCRVVSLCDHISPITDLVFLRGDLKIVTTSLDGSVYSWNIGGAARDKEFVQKGIAATHVVATKHHKKTCTIVASFESDVSEAAMGVFPSSAQGARRKQSVMVRRASGVLDVNGLEDGETSSRPEDELQRAISAFSDARSVSSGMSTAGGGPKQAFLAVWTDDVSPTPTIVQLDMPARSIAVGRSGGTDRIDLCIVGFDDGRVLISALPFPLILLRGGIGTVSMPLVAAAAMLKRRKNSVLALAAGKGDAAKDSKDAKGLAKVGFGSHFASKADDASVHSASSSTNQRRELAAAKKPTSSSSATAAEDANGADALPSAGDDASRLGDAAADEGGGDAQANGALVTKKYRLDESKCRWLRLMAGAVTTTCFSVEGDWLVVGGDEGTLMMLSTFRALGDDLAQRSLFSIGSAPHAGANEAAAEAADSALETRTNVGDDSQLQFFLMERARVASLKARMTDLEQALDQSKRENELHVAKMLEAKEKAYVDMEARLKREVSKRDEAIISSRKEYLTMKRSMTEEVERLKKASADGLSTMEMAYEKKIAQDALYMDRLKQAYDEYVLHMKLDMSDLNAQTAAKVKVIEHERQEALREAEKQKRAVLAYYEYLQARNDEVLGSLEEAQADERLRMKKQLEDTQDRLQVMQASTMSNEVHHGRVIAKFEADKKHMELEILRVNNDIDWANDRIAKLEEALANATNELRIRSELVERAEVKASEATKKADDLEKIRRTLMVQLEALQRDISPKDRELAKITDRMQELAREYEVALSAIAEKEKTLEHKTQNLLLLQKQVRELRQSGAQKETALARAATLLHEFLHAMQEARFQPRKSLAAQQREAFLEQRAVATSFDKGGTAAATTTAAAKTGAVSSAANPAATIDPGSPQGAQQAKAKKKEALSASDPHYIVSSLHLDQGADMKLRSLHDVLKNFMSDATKDAEIVDEVEAVRREQDRHVTLLHRNIKSLRSSLESSQALASTKIHNHLADNEVLLREVNALRSEVKALSLENHRLQATLDFRQTAANTPRSQQDSFVSDAQPQQPLPLPMRRSRPSSTNGLLLHDALSQLPGATPPATSAPPVLPIPLPADSQSALSLPRLAASSALQSQLGRAPFAQQISQSQSQLSGSLRSLGLVEVPSSVSRAAPQKSQLSRSTASLESDAAASHGDLFGAAMSADDKIAALMQMNMAELRGHGIGVQSPVAAAGPGAAKAAGPGRATGGKKTRKAATSAL